MNYLEILDQVRAHVASLFHAKENDTENILLYHNLLHTEQVVMATVKIANHYQLADQDFFIVSAAAWFHDVGYLTGMQDHEVRGAASAREFLAEKGVDQGIIEQVENCIKATQMPQHPVNLLEQIVCDADLFHLGDDSFKERSKLIRKEVNTNYGVEISKHAWKLKTLALLENHHYHTAYCQELLSAKKERNLKELKEKVAEEEHKLEKEAHKEEHQLDKETSKHHHQDKKEHQLMHAELLKEVQKTGTDKGLKKKDEFAEETTLSKKKKSDRPDKGIETMFRITSGNHQRLSDMADNKAHIMISTNSIILSVILSILLRKLEDNPHLIVPTLLLLIICVTTMVFSILATRPSVPPGTFTAQDIKEKKTNLLFFGNFYRMDLASYTAGMEQMMEDRDFLYGSLIRDLYSQGVVLGRKYRLLRIAYNVFMFGIIASVLAFIVASAIVAL